MKFLGKKLIFIALLVGITAQGADIQSKEKTAQQELDEQLVKAVKYDETDQVRILLLEKANPNYRDKNNEKVISHAIENGNGDIVALLLSHGADANRVCKFARTPLTTAMSVMEECISNKKPNEADLCVYIIDSLLYHRADPSRLYVSTRPLERSINFINRNHDRDVSPVYNLVALLLEYGADDTAVDRDGKTIHDYIAKNSQLQDFLNYRLKDRRREIKSSIADGIPTMGLDPVGVIAGYVI